MAQPLRPLMCPAGSNVGRLAGAVAARIRQGAACEIEAVGPEAQHKAVKAVGMASRYLQDDNAGSRLVFVPRRASLAAGRGGQPETVMLRLQCHLLAGLESTDSRDVIVGGDTNPGLAAKTVQEVLAQRSVATIGGMGPMAMSRALKTLVVANVYMRKSLRPGEAILAAPSVEDAGPDGDRIRFLLTCTRGEAKRASAAGTPE
mmetsp:Transcript_67132/g.174813  ORF Transcript_67132/g.174813 Transcript_67132/m.174813 type:complete len:203 (-) Transcript_67132:12-620(-)